MDLTPELLTFTPIFLPVAKDRGWNLCIGICTPPVDQPLFVGAAIAAVPVRPLLQPIIPFGIAFATVLDIVTPVPEISLFLTRVLLGYGE